MDTQWGVDLHYLNNQFYHIILFVYKTDIQLQLTIANLTNSVIFNYWPYNSAIHMESTDIDFRDDRS